jgi:hypothetical protein
MLICGQNLNIFVSFGLPWHPIYSQIKIITKQLENLLWDRNGNGN